MNPLFNASSLPLTANPGTLPNMADTIAGYFQLLTFTTLVKTVENFQVVETPTTTTFMGVRQPFTPQQLMLKPEGQRAWKWEMIHAHPSLILSPDDVVNFDGRPYRVMQKNDYKEYGYVEYHIVEGFTGDGA